MPSSIKLGVKNIKTVFCIAVLAVPVLCYMYVGLMRYRNVDVDFMSYLLQFRIPWKSSYHRQGTNSTIHIAVVICGSRLEEGLVMLKSAVIFSHSYLVLHVFTEQKLKQSIKDEFASWPYSQRSRLKLAIHTIEFPTIPGCKTCTPNEWKKLFRPCAAQRLFIPDILKDVDSLIYLDTDTVFLTSVEKAWEQFTHFGQNHVFGIVPELEPWYSKNTVPYCTKTGVNSGVMWMNLTRVRAVKWLNKIQEYFQTYRRKLSLGDQDLINVYCSFNLSLFYIMNCTWNYRGRFCYSDKLCKEALSTGIDILHANRQIFHDIKRSPHIAQVYRAFKEYNLSRHRPQDLYESIANRIKPFSETKCGQRLHLFTRNLQKYVIDYKSRDGMTLR